MYNIAEITNAIISGHALTELQKFPSDSIDCVITSSPYFGLRFYQTVSQIWGGDKNCNHNWNSFEHKGTSGGTKSAKVQVKDKNNFQIVPNSQQGICSCGAWLGELGQEPTPQMFIEHLVEIFMECARVLKPEGTMWINIADSYAANRKRQIDGTKQISGSQPKVKQPQARDFGITPKSLMGIPDRLKIALIDNGLICRNQIIWWKPNKMPESCKDRFTNDYEMLYFFTKNQNYYFEQQLEPYKSKENHNPRNKNAEKYNGTNLFSDGGRDYYSQGGKNVRTVWNINTVPSKIPHFAVFPQQLIERPISAGCPKNGLVLDPFVGSGTTARVAKRLGRNYVGIELNPQYLEYARKSLQ